jgi:hypothetical protein
MTAWIYKRKQEKWTEEKRNGIGGPRCISFSFLKSKAGL